MEDAVPAAGVVTVVGEPVFPNWLASKRVGCTSMAVETDVMPGSCAACHNLHKSERQA